MYSVRKGIIISFMLMAAFSVLTATDETDAIYEKIRYSGPRYEWEESIVNFTNEGMNLVCSLTVPKIRRSRPIIITLNGFAGTRDEATIPGTEEGIFKRTTRILAEQGFCSLRVDFRGSGDSDGTYDITTFSSQVSDTLAAIEFIQRLDDPVNPDKIGIIGFSQGGLVGSIAASRDKRVESIVLWSAVAYPSHDYEGLLTKPGLKQGLALEEGESIILPIYIEGQKYGDITLGNQFFNELFQVCLLCDLRNYRNPLMYIAGVQDVIVWPQPHIGDTYLKYHNGNEKLVVLDADHAFNYWDGPVPEKLDDAIYWSTAWFMETMRRGRK